MYESEEVDDDYSMPTAPRGGVRYRDRRRVEYQENSPTRKSGIRQQQDLIEIELDRFSKLVEEFDNRLRPILNPEYPTASTPGGMEDQAEPSSGLAGELERYVERLRTIGSQFEYLLGRVDL